MREFRLNGRRALTLTELMIGMGLAAIIVLAAVLYTFKFSEKARIEIVKSELRESVAVALRRFDSDLSSAIRVRGEDALFRPGVYRADENGLPTEPREPGENDRIVMFVLKNKELSVPIDGINILNTLPPQLSGTLRIKEVNAPPGTPANSPEAILAWNAQRYMDIVLKRPGNSASDWFLISNASTNIILKKSLYTGNSSTADVPVRFTLPVGFSLESEDFRRGTRLYHVAKVHYFIENQNLYRAELLRDRAPSVEDAQLILPNVTEFQINYLFADRRSTRDDEPLPIPYEAISHPEEGHTNLDERLNWTDISGVNGVIRVFSGKQIDGDAGSSDESFEISNGRVFYRAQFMTSPTSFESLLQDSSSVGSDPCHPSQASARCNPACVNVFTDDNRNSPRWRGYGRHVNHPEGPSDYCICGTDRTNPADPKFFPPETSTGRARVPNWTREASTERKVQLAACMREFASCSSGTWRDKDVRYRMGCGCTNDSSEFMEAWDPDEGRNWYPGFPLPDPAWSDPIIPGGIHASNWQTFYSTLRALDAGTYTYTDSPDDPANVLNCRVWMTCGDLARTWLGADGSQALNNRGGFGTHCRCMTHVENGEGELTTQQIDRSHKSWTDLCNPARCPDLFDGGNYKIHGAGDDEHALSLQEATYCECRNLPAADVRIENEWDFRLADALGSAPPSTPVSAGTVGSRLVDVPTEDGVVAGQVCTEAQCGAQAGRTTGCCASRRLTGTPRAEWNAHPDVLEEFRNSHSGYCLMNQCSSPANVLITRRALFGLPPNAPSSDLPSFCGGPTGGGGGGGEPDVVPGQ